MSTSDRVHLERSGHVAVVRLDNAPVNAIDDAMIAALSRQVRLVADDGQARSVLIWGGPDHFAAGADIDRLAAMDFSEVVTWNAKLQGVFTEVANLPIPVVAAISGFALGGGMELALAADYRICSDRARLGQPEIKLGIIPGSGGTQRLTRIVGRSRALELLLSGRHLRAPEALELAIVNEVVPAEVLFDKAMDVAAAFAAAPRFAARAIKEAVNAAEPPVETGLALERALMAGLFATPDRDIGMSSFMKDGPGKARFE